jgi:hypothetical protein
VHGANPFPLPLVGTSDRSGNGNTDVALSVLSFVIGVILGIWFPPDVGTAFPHILGRKKGTGIGPELREAMSGTEEVGLSLMFEMEIAVRVHMHPAHRIDLLVPRSGAFT